MSLPFLQPYFGLSNSLQTAQASAGGGGVGGWVELGRTTLGSASDNCIVSSLADKRYLMILGYGLANGNTTGRPQLNGDTGSNYSDRLSTNGGADGSQTNISYLDWDAEQTNNTHDKFKVGYIANYTTKEKLLMNHGVDGNTVGAGYAPVRYENVSKWANTSSAINSFNLRNANSGDWASGTECVVLGWDPADTHTTNFWTELASDTLGSAGDTFTSSTFTAKKYLWVQGYIINSGTTRVQLRYNGDTGSNYSNRGSNNGSADSTNTSMDRNYIQEDPTASPVFFNAFIINNSANEKLGIVHTMERGTAGAGTIGARRETVVKWANTAAQITSISILQDQSGDMASGSIMKVWGSD